MIKQEETPQFYITWINSIAETFKIPKVNEHAPLFQEEEELPIFFVMMPEMLITVSVIAYFFYGLLPHEAAMQFWEHFTLGFFGHIFNHGLPTLGRLFTHALPTLGHLMYMLIMRLFTTPSQGAMPPNLALPPQPSSNHLNLPVVPHHPHRSLFVQGATVFSPETVLGCLINNTQSQQAFTALLLTQVTGSLPGCSTQVIKAIKAIQALQALGIKTGNFACNLWLQGKKLTGTCGDFGPTRIIDPSSGITCAPDGGSPPPPGTVKIEIANGPGGYLWFWHAPVDPSVTQPLTPTQELPGTTGTESGEMTLTDSDESATPSGSGEETGTISDWQSPSNSFHRTRSQSLTDVLSQNSLQLYWVNASSSRSIVFAKVISSMLSNYGSMKI